MKTRVKTIERVARRKVSVIEENAWSGILGYGSFEVYLQKGSRFLSVESTAYYDTMPCEMKYRIKVQGRYAVVEYGGEFGSYIKFSNGDSSIAEDWEDIESEMANKGYFLALDSDTDVIPDEFSSWHFFWLNMRHDDNELIAQYRCGSNYLKFYGCVMEREDTIIPYFEELWPDEDRFEAYRWDYDTTFGCMNWLELYGEKNRESEMKSFLSSIIEGTFDGRVEYLDPALERLVDYCKKSDKSFDEVWTKLLEIDR